MKHIFLLLLALATSAHAAFVAQNGIIASNGVNVATGVISGNGSGVTNIPGFVEVTVSPKGIVNGLATVPNDGKQFGPDTTGTTTSGLQEALNSMPKGTEYGPTATGIRVRVASGYLYFTNTIIASNLYTCFIAIEGSDLLSTKLVYAGSGQGTNTIWFKGGHNPNHNPADGSYDMPLHVELRNLGFTALSNTTNILVCITNYSHAKVENCNFTSWQLMTNQAWGSAVSVTADSGFSQGGVPGLVGLVIGNANEHATFLRDNYFAGLATGLYALCDHLYVEGIKFADVGLNADTLQDITLWPNTSPFSLGACILRRPGLDSHYLFPHFYACQAGLAVLNAGNNSDYQHIFDPIAESCDFPLSAQTPKGVTIGIDSLNDITGTMKSTDWQEFWIKTSPYSFVATNLLSKRVAYNFDTFIGSGSQFTNTSLYGTTVFSGTGAGTLYFENSTGTSTNAGYNGTDLFGSGGGLTNVGFNAVTKTSNFTIPSTWVEATISNKGASVDTTNTLPPGLPGMQFTVVGEAAHFIAFKVQPGEVIHNFASSGFTNAWTSASAVPFANFTVKCSSAGVWWIQSANGLTIGTQ